MWHIDFQVSSKFYANLKIYSNTKTIIHARFSQYEFRVSLLYFHIENRKIQQCHLQTLCYWDEFCMTPGNLAASKVKFQLLVAQRKCLTLTL